MHVKYLRNILTIANAICYLWCLLVVWTLQLIPSQNTLDYPIAVVSAQRILLGQIPYIDFTVLYGPLGHYILAFGLWLFNGEHPAHAANIVFAVFATVYITIINWLVYKNRSASVFTLSIVLLYEVICTPIIGFYGSYSIIPLVLVVIASIGIDSALDDVSNNIQLPLIAFSVISVVVLFIRLNFGAYLIFAAGLTLVLRAYFTRNNKVKPLIYFIFALSGGLLVSWAILNACGFDELYLSEMIDYLSKFESRHMPISVYLKDRDMLRLFVAAIAIVVCVSMRFLLEVFYKQIGSYTFWGILLLCFFHYYFVRADILHFLPLMLLCPLLLLNNSLVGGGKAKLLSNLAFLTVSIILLAKSWGLAQSLSSHNKKHEDAVVVNGVEILKAEDEMIKYLQCHMKSNESIYWTSLPGSCESTSHVCVNISLYLAQKNVPKEKVWFYDTPLTPYRDVQEEIVADLKKHRYNWIGVQGLISNTGVPSRVKEDSTVFNYVKANYKMVQKVLIPKANREYLIFKADNI